MLHEISDAKHLWIDLPTIVLPRLHLHEENVKF